MAITRPMFNVMIGILVVLVLFTYFATKPIVSVEPSFVNIEDNRYLYVIVPRVNNKVPDEVILPYPPDLLTVVSYTVLLPVPNGQNQKLQIRVPFPITANVLLGSSFNHGNVNISALSTTTFVSKVIDSSLQWEVASNSIPTYPQELIKVRGRNAVIDTNACVIPPKKGENSWFENNKWLFAAGQGMYTILKGAYTGSISDVFNGGKSMIETLVSQFGPKKENEPPQPNVACMMEALSRQLEELKPFIQDQVERVMIDNAQRWFQDKLLTLTFIVTQMNNNISLYQSQKVIDDKTDSEYAINGDPNIVNSFNKCIGGPVPMRNLLLGTTSNDQICFGTPGIIDLRDQLLGDLGSTGSLEYFIYLLNQGLNEPDSPFVDPKFMFPLILPTWQLIVYYQTLHAEGFQVMNLPETPSVTPNSPWEVPTAYVPYNVYQENMIRYMKTMEQALKRWKDLLVTYVRPYEPIVPSGTAYFCAAANPPYPPGSCCNVGSNACTAGEIHIFVDTSGQSWNRPFNSNQSYWNNRTCYNAPEPYQQTCLPCRSKVLRETSLQEALDSEKGRFADDAPVPANLTKYGLTNIDFPAGLSAHLILPKYIGQPILNDLTLRLTSNSNGICITKNDWPIMDADGVDRSPHDEFPLQQQILIDKVFAQYANNVVNVQDGPGDIENAFFLMYEIAGLIPSKDPINEDATKMALITVSGRDYMPGYPFGYSRGNFYEDDAYVYCTNSTNIEPLSLPNSEKCALNDFYKVPAASLQNVVDGIVDVDVNNVACPQNTSYVRTCFKPNQQLTLSVTSVGNVNTPEPLSRVLVCGHPGTTLSGTNTLKNVETQATTCDTIQTVKDFVIDITCASFHVDNPLWYHPLANAQGLCYNKYIFSINKVILAPSVGARIRIERVDRKVKYLFVATNSGNGLTGYPTGTNADSETIPLDFLNITDWTTTATATEFIVWHFGPATQRSQLAYLTQKCFLTFM